MTSWGDRLAVAVPIVGMVVFFTMLAAEITHRRPARFTDAKVRVDEGRTDGAPADDGVLLYADGEYVGTREFQEPMWRVIDPSKDDPYRWSIILTDPTCRFVPEGTNVVTPAVRRLAVVCGSRP